MVAAGEDAAEAEDDDEEEGSAEGEAQGRPRCIDVWRRVIGALHSWWGGFFSIFFGDLDLNLDLDSVLLLSCV